MKPISKLSTRDQVVISLRKAIFNGDLKNGEELIQEEIAKKLDVSRMPVREAFQVLEREGLLVTNPNRRVVVKGLTKEDIKDHYEIRAMLEGEAAARASKSDLYYDELVEIQQAIEKAIENNDVGSYTVANEHFHRTVWRASESERLQTLLDQIWNGLPPHLAEVLPIQMDKALVEHKEVIQAVSEKNERKARKAMENHITRSMEDFLATIEDRV